MKQKILNLDKLYTRLDASNKKIELLEARRREIDENIARLREEQRVRRQLVAREAHGSACYPY